MRPLLLLLACSACSLALDTDELRGLQDGGLRDAPIVDGGDRPDADVMLVDGDVPDATDSGPDGGCPELMPTEIFGETGGPLSVRFCTEATVVVACSASANGNVVNFDLPVGDAMVELPNTFITALPLFHEATVDIACPDSVTLPIPDDYHSLEELEEHFTTVVGVGATMDIDDNGTVVFAGSNVTAPDQEADVFHWRVDEPLEPLVVRTSADGGGLLAPRISDDGRVVTYNDAEDRRFRAVNVADGTMGAVFPRSTASVSNDLRGDSAAGYQFVMREWQPEPEGPDVLAYRAFTLTDFVSGGTVELAMTDVNPTHPGRSPRLFDNGTASGVSAVSSAAAGSANGFVVQDAAEPTALNVFDECEVDVQRGLFASNGNRVALVGRCDGAISDPQFWLRASDGVAIGGLVVPDGIDGLLAVSDDFRYYLVRGDGGYRGIIRQISDGNFDARRLAPDRRTFTGITLLSTAALSPNGQWAVLALNDGDRTRPHEFRIARVRVH